MPPQLAEICKAVALPKPTVFRILATLEAAGLVREEGGRVVGANELYDRFFRAVL